MRQANGEFRIPRGRRHVCLESAARVLGRRHNGRVDHRVKILLRTIGREQEGGVFAAAGGSGQESFIDAALLERLVGREVLLSVQAVVAEGEVELAMVIGGRGLADDLNLAAPGVVVLRRVWVLIDVDLLDGGGRDGHTIGLNAIHHQC